MMYISRARRAPVALMATAFLLASASPAMADVDLADKPLFSTVSVPGNLLLALSVEYPTASTSAYPSTTAYASASTYVGYFDPAKCYTYSYNTATPASSYFAPNSFAPVDATTKISTHVCSSSMWSGNWLNWAGMQSLDEFRWVLTGGNRLVDTSSQTVLQKTYHSGQDTSSAANKSTGSSFISGATPLSSWTVLNSRISGTGTLMLVAAGNYGCTTTVQTGNSTTSTTSFGSATDVSATSSTTSGSGKNQTTTTTTTACTKLTAMDSATAKPSASTYTLYTNQSSPDTSTVYALYMNVQVCTSATLKEDNCVLHGSIYKPEGLMQSYSSKLRYGAMGYLNDASITRDGGVLRAGMKYIGPTQPVPGSPAVTNSLAEWSSTDGTMAADPNSSDSSATTQAAKDAGALSTFSIGQSGVMNYLNKFGYYASSYKQYDPVSELYYAGIRYFKNLGNVSTYSSLSGGTSTTIPAWLDGFPVVTSWSDPIAYACQKNFILGIGDVNTHRDSNLPGSTLYATAKAANQEPAIPPEVTADTTVDVAKATNMVGLLESGSTTLANTWVNGGRYDTYYVAGLAYDAHTKDIRSDLPDAQTISTYWLDVLEGQKYIGKNEYYYATKYGGFALAEGVQAYGGTNPNKTTLQPYASGNATDTLSTSTGTSNTVSGSLSLAINSSGANSMWHINSDRCSGTSLCSSSNTTGDYRPDNYFTAANADGMKSSLTAAFEKIVKEAGTANSTALATPSVNTTQNGSVSYGATYDANSWTGVLAATTITIATDGTPTISAKWWDAGALLSATTVTKDTRKIITCCTSSTTAPGLEFTAAGLGGSTVIAPASNAYAPSTGAYFARVPGVSSSYQNVDNYLAYLRGDKSQELSASSGHYRTRSSRLGDIVNSKPTTVTPPNQGYFDSSNAGYAAFKSAYASRATVVYVGANDGMLHAFDGSTGAANSGQELFAYVPSFVYGDSTTATTTGIATLGSPTFVHHYFVDATAGTFDVDLVNTYASSTQKATSTTRSMCTASQTSAATNWCTLLIGGLGKGGKGYYALDVTDPAAWSNNGATAAANQATLASKVMWEFTDTHMGYSFGTPSVVKTKKWGWVVVMTSGYNNDDGIGYFYLVSPSTGQLLERVATTSGSTSSPINMGQHTAFEPDYTDGTADAIYGVDLQGDVWRLDVTATSGSYPAPTLIATLKDGSANAQPITTRPLVEPDSSSSARYLLVGTGRLLGDSDIVSGRVQSFYAIIDGTATFGGFYTGGSSGTLPSSVTFPIVRSELNANTDLLTGITAAAGTVGWYYDLPVTGGIAERVNVDPTATNGVIAWAGNLPNGSACSPAGTADTYATAFSTGKTVLWDDTTGAYKSSFYDALGVIADMSFLNVNGTTYLYSGDSKGNITKDTTKIGSTGGVKQMNWRDVPLAN